MLLASKYVAKHLNYGSLSLLKKYSSSFNFLSAYHEISFKITLILKFSNLGILGDLNVTWFSFHS